MRSAKQVTGSRVRRGGTSSATFEALEARTLFTTLVVDNNPADHATYTTIQSAVNAARAGYTIDVKPGIYTEAVTIPAADNNLTLIAVTSSSRGPSCAPVCTPTASGAVTIEPPATAVAGIHIDDPQNVTITGFTISGSSNAGILVNGGASATIEYDHITGPGGILSGFYEGIYVASGSAQIYSNVVDSYVKRGILVGTAIENLPTSPSKANLPLCAAYVEGNTVVGAGPATIVQNGIEFAFGAFGFIEYNTVSENIDGPQDGLGTGILLFDAGPSLVAANTAFNNDTDIVLDTGAEEGMSFIAPGALEVVCNTVYGATFDGIDLFGVISGYIGNNSSTNNGFDGVYLEESSSNYVVYNLADSNTLNGIELVSSNDNVIEGNDADSNGDNGISLEDSNGNVVLCNLADFNGGTGIALSSANSNFVVENDANSNGANGISLTDSSGNQISLDDASKNGTFGIEVDSASTNNAFTFDSLCNNGAASAYDASSGSGTAGTANFWARNRGNGITIPTGLVRG
jgi:parallel beta-helix repeat protein